MRMPGNLDKPEPRWQAILALIGVGGIYTALPGAERGAPVVIVRGGNDAARPNGCRPSNGTALSESSPWHY